MPPAEPGRLDTMPPRANGGNLDTKDLVAGSAQGDGEVCGTGIEAPMTVTARFDLRDDFDVAEFQIRRAAARQPLAGEVHIMTAHGPALFASTRRVTRSMVDWVGREFGLSASDAYIICSIAADLHISEVVDAPNWLVSMHLPLGIFGH